MAAEMEKDNVDILYWLNCHNNFGSLVNVVDLVDVIMTVDLICEMEKITENGIAREFYYLDGNAIAVREDGAVKYYLAFTDNLGSILSVMDEYGTKVSDASYEKSVAFLLCLVDFPFDSCNDGKPSLGSCTGSYFGSLLNGIEHSAAPCFGNLREKTMLNGVLFGAARRIIRDSDIDAEFLGHLYETPLELPAPCAVVAVAVTEDDDVFQGWIYVYEVLLPLYFEAVTGKLCGVMICTESHIAGIPRDVVNAVRNQLPAGNGGIAMVVKRHRSEATKEFILRVHAEYDYSLRPAFAPQLTYVDKMLVAQRIFSQRQRTLNYFIT